MNTKNIIQQFFNENIIVEIDDNFSDNDSFLENGLIDSTGVLELVMFIEREFGIKVEDDEIIPENIDSFSNLENYINSKK